MDHARQRFKLKYGATPFDPKDPRDARSERARKVLVGAALASMKKLDARTGEDMQDIAGGLLVGLVGVMFSFMESTDANHAALRASLIQLMPWAVDLVRDMEGLPPLSDGN